jgi:Fe-S cluster assembly ATP-binding protein
MAILEISDLTARVGDTPILRGVNLTVQSGEMHALMGPNGSGKSTLSNVVMGHPGYTVTGGDVRLDGRSILKLPTHERALAGLFLAFQYPMAVSGVSVANFIRTAVNARRTAKDPEDRGVDLMAFMKELRVHMDRLKLDIGFTGRSINDGFSGGEKKRLEMLQMAMLKPALAILDEPDSGLDIDAVRIVAEGVTALSGPDIGFLIITHYQRILNYVKPDKVHVMVDGRIVRSGGQELAQELEAQGYDWLRRETEDAAV